MMNIVKFTVGSPDSSGEMSAEVEASISNAAEKDVRWIQYRMIFEDARGFPLASSEGMEDCRLENGDSTELSSSCCVSSATAGGQQDSLVVHAVATLYGRDVYRLGELAVPAAEMTSATLEKAIEGSALHPMMKVLAVRSKNDENGQNSVAIRVLVTNSSPSLLERVELRYELLDSEESSLEAGEECTLLPAGGLACIEASTSWWRPSQLKGARLRLSLSVYQPLAIVTCTGESSAGDEDFGSSDETQTDEDDDVSDFDDDDSDTDLEEGSNLDEDSDDEEDGDDVDSDEEETSNSVVGTAQGAGLDDKVMAVLRAAGALEMVDAFRQNQITDDLLQTLSDGDLVQIGVSALGLRRRILAEIAGQANASGGPSRVHPVSSAPHDESLASSRRTTDWSKVLAKYGPVFTGFDRAIPSPKPDHRKLVGALDYVTAVHRNLKPLLVYDDTFFGSGKDGLLVSDLGIHWRNLYQEPKFVPWASLHSVKASGKAVVLEPGGEISCAYAGAKCAQVLASFINHSAGAAMISLSAISHPQQSELLDAVRAMRNVDGDGFVIVEDPATGRIVQFCNGELGPVLDVPKVEYSDAQCERAAGYLEQCGFDVSVPKGNPSFQREYDPSATVQMVSEALGALRGIHNLRIDVPLTITKLWT